MALTIQHLEDHLTKIAAGAFGPTVTHAYVETGRYKPYSEATVRAAKARGYRVELRARGVYHVFPKAPGVRVLTASFQDTERRIRGLVASMVQRTGSECPVTIKQVGTNCHVIGAAQAVMFVIGEVAAHGEDTLICVVAA